ncbi:hypothetical protein BJV82DRAFT_600328 [Fennellomyces sp. T-0311]|nr:hypothetical protein BJV82DRAFT_600328 [Fennellomyces sp. T-0311]
MAMDTLGSSSTSTLPLSTHVISSSVSSSKPEDNIKAATKRKEVHEVSATVCSNCGTTTTPLWRRAPNGDTICNACGLYYKARNQFRPPTLKRNTARKDDPQPVSDCGSGPEIGSCPGGGHCNGSGGSASCAGCPAFNQHQVNRQALICANCRTTTTPLWRRDEAGNTICNACGLYYKLHNMHRPVSMKRSVIKRRKRVVVAEAGEDSEEGSAEDSLVSEENTQQQHQVHAPEKKQGKRIKGLKAPSKKKEEVPAIEDYILPRRLPPPQPSTSSPSTSSISSPTSPPQIVAPRPMLPLPQMDRIYNNSHEHTYHLPPISSSSSSSSPPSSHHGQHRGIDSLLQAAADCERLPPISLPAPQAPTAPLAEFDAALTRLNQLRSRASSSRETYALSQLTPSLIDLIRRAEASI